MECDICTRFSSGDHPLHCPACARAALYPYRLDQARSLVEKERLRREVEAVLPKRHVVHGEASSAAIGDAAPGTKKLQHEINLAGFQRSRETIEAIVNKSESLKEKVALYKQEIEKKKTTANERRRKIEASQAEFANSRPTMHEQLRKAAKRRVHRYDSLYKDIVSARIFLCREAAELAGLRRHQRKAPDSSTLESYTLNSLPIIDLRDLNNTPPQRITASLTSISRLLIQVCYFLEIRLPVEITLPGENYPLPTAFSPASSFQAHNKDVNFPGIISSTPSSPTASRTIDPQEQTCQSKPRPLYLDRKLPVLMREDPSQYTHFIEGVSLLAWAVAWLCRTQGLQIASTDWEEICAVGRNLWLLLVDAPTTAAERQQQSRKDARPKLTKRGTSDTSSKSTTSSSPTDTPKPSRPIEFGTLSHGTAHTLLLLASSASVPTPSSSSSSSASALAPSPTTSIDISPRAWKFASPTSIRDSLKKYLLNEMSAQEWEVLSSGEFEGWVRGPADDEPVVVGPSKARTMPSDGMTQASKRDDESGKGISKTGGEATAAPDGNEAGGDDRPKGSSGWMKLKSRSTY